MEKKQLNEQTLRKIIRNVIKEMIDATLNNKFEEAFNTRQKRGDTVYMQYGDRNIAIWRDNDTHKWDFECGDEFNRVIPPYNFEPEEKCLTLKEYAKALIDFIESGESNTYGFEEDYYNYD